MLKRLALTFFLIFSPLCYAVDVPITVFPLKHYNQNIDHWINPKNFSNFNKSLLSPKTQKKYFKNFKHYWLSPWNQKRIMTLIKNSDPSVRKMEEKILNIFDNLVQTDNPKFYGSNFRLHSKRWIKMIRGEINLKSLDNLRYNSKNRAILIYNAQARALPTTDVSFYKFVLPGEGYPFDYIQISSLWAGTPAYILAQTKNRDWSLILTSGNLAWVPSNSLAKVNSSFITKWTKATNNKLAAIVHTKTPFKNTQSKHFYFDAYVGSIYPLLSKNKLLFPILSDSGFAKIVTAKLPTDDFVEMPYLPTPNHFSRIIKSLIGRPYGWGGLYYHNDCSQELRSLFTVFGIWLPRHSSNQINVGKVVDKSDLSTDQRIQYLMQNGHPLMTIVYIGGHIFLYIGNFIDPNSSAHKKIALTYQNLWALKPHDRSRRAIVGMSILLPLLPRYPEDPNLSSLASKKYFKVSYLDQPNNLTVDEEPALNVKLQSLMFP